MRLSKNGRLRDEENPALAFTLKAVCLAGLVGSFCLGMKAQSTTRQQQKADLYVQTGHVERVNSLAFSPDGKILASGSSDTKIKLWNAETGLELQTLTGHTVGVNALAFSPDGKTLASGGADKLVKLWSVENGQELRTLTGHTGSVDSIMFSPDGKTLASGSWDGSIKLWSVDTGREPKTLTGHTYYTDALAFSPDGKTLASGGADELIKLWNVENGQELRTLRGHTHYTTSLVFSRDGKTLTSGNVDGTVRLWSVETGQELRTLVGPIQNVTPMAFSPDGKTLASKLKIDGGKDWSIKLWSLETGQELRRLTGNTSTIGSMMFSPDGKTLALGSWDRSIKLWSIETGQELRTLTGYTELVHSISLSPDGKILASKGLAKISLWSLDTGQELRTLKGNAYVITSVEFSPDGKTLASGGTDELIRLWSVKTGQELRTLTGHTGDVSSVAFSPDGKTLASGSKDETVRLWSVETGQELRALSDDDEVNAVWFSPDGKILASQIANEDGHNMRLTLWSVETGQKLRTLSGVTLAFSPDSKTYALQGKYSPIRLWSVETGQELRTFGGSNYAGLLVFSPDGKTLASSVNKLVNLWGVETGQLVRTLDRSDPHDQRELHSLVPDYVYFREPITRDGRFQFKLKEHNDLVTGVSGYLDLCDVNTGKLLASLIDLGEAGWAVVTPDGLFDGSPNAWKLLSWRLSDKLYDIAPVEAFFKEFYRPGLLQDILTGRKIERPTRDLSTIDIRQPEVKVKLSNAEKRPAQIPARQIIVTVEVKDAPADKKRRTSSGAQDVRLFRNGSLVKVWRGDVLQGKSSVTLEATVPIVAGANNFTAYAFNHDNIKSSDATLVINGADTLKRQGTAYILAVGVNRYSNSRYNLKYAVADSQDFSAEVKRQQESLKRYAQVEVISLSDAEATKANITEKLRQLATRVQPEDAVIVYFAGHGTAHGNQFYLIPHDLGYRGPRENLSQAGLQTILDHSISDRQLEKLFEGIDAGQLLLVIDACNSGQALEAEEKRRGPMNSKGLAQLAYEKGMYVLTAAQSYQAAQEAAKFGHGFLTYALVEEGLKHGAADREPKNGAIDLREWLNYATDEVPKMQEENSLEALRGRGRFIYFVGDGSRSRDANKTDEARDNVQRPRLFYRREADANPLVVAVLATTAPQ
jgi:WD40 repeat protein/translation initiation factor IF-1